MDLHRVAGIGDALPNSCSPAIDRIVRELSDKHTELIDEQLRWFMAQVGWDEEKAKEHLYLTSDYSFEGLGKTTTRIMLRVPEIEEDAVVAEIVAGMALEIPLEVWR